MIQTSDLWCWKRLLYPLRHHHCPNWNTLFMKYFLQRKRTSLLKLPFHENTESPSYQLNKLIKLARLKQVMWRQKIELTFWHQYCKDISEMGSSGSSLSFLLHSRISSVFELRKKLPTHSESLWLQYDELCSWLEVPLPENNCYFFTTPRSCLLWIQSNMEDPFIASLSDR